MPIKCVAFLDKPWPPEHSFVEGMLSSVLREQGDISTTLVVSREDNKDISPRRFKKSTCFPFLLTRSGVSRLLNFFYVARALSLIRNKSSKHGSEPLKIFVRNDPVMLLACSLFKKRDEWLCFQSSHPHEEVTGNKLKRSIAKMFFRLSRGRVDGITAVSPLGLERVKRIFPASSRRGVIPLLSDMPVGNFFPFPSKKESSQPLSFIYAGTHYPSRRLHVVFDAILDYVEGGGSGRFFFVGAKDDELDYVNKLASVKKLTSCGVLRVCGRMPRDKVLEEIRQSDVGLSVAPPSKHYAEMSPTKLAEYMGLGVATLASKGIDFQDKVIEESGCGVLAEFSSESLAEAMRKIDSDRDLLYQMRLSAIDYSRDKFNYGLYVAEMRHCLGCD